MSAPPFLCGTCGKVVEGNASDLRRRFKAAVYKKLFCNGKCFAEFQRWLDAEKTRLFMEHLKEISK